ncbi:hypothetical protein RR48_06329 [Papilio machaon]|uniref:Activity-regulated cytoskeleton-associated protein n=1 Tax=Papilio machaon TaxID=76193 RepID=A0A194QZY2_PAPMA|nr:hypothetical protein RR48_06329 [Papilio machaon]
MPLTRSQDRQQRRDYVMPVEDANANENHEEHDSPHDRRHAESSGNNSTFNLDDVSALMASLQRSQAETFKNIMSYVMEQRSSTPAAPPMPPVNVDGTLARCKASFSGAPGESVEAFIDAIESYTECVQVSDANIIRGLAMLLSADAATWWLGLKHHISTWNEAKENLIYAYGTRLPPHRVYLEIFASPQVEENTDKFVARVRALMAKLPRDDISEKVQLDMVYGLLHNRIRTRLRREEFTSFNSLLSHARNIEDSLEETQPRPSTSALNARKSSSVMELTIVRRHISRADNELSLLNGTKRSVVQTTNLAFVATLSLEEFRLPSLLTRLKRETIIVKSPKGCVFYECIARCRQRGYLSGGYCTINGCQCLG